MTHKLLEKDNNCDQLKYGTAGYRTLADNLDVVAIRLGIFSALRSIIEGGKFVGVMITASHNAEHDNGIKLVDASGEMLPDHLEPEVERFVRADPPQLVQLVTQQLGRAQSQSREEELVMRVALAGDTRSSTPRLIAQVKLGLSLFSAASDDANSTSPLFNSDFAEPRKLRVECADLGFISTPMCHFLLHKMNDIIDRNATNQYFWNDVTHLGCSAQQFARQLYYEKHFDAFDELMKMRCVINNNGDDGNFKESQTINVDCACGVGGEILRDLIDVRNCKMRGDSNSHLQLNLFNCPGAGPLNHLCGSDFVKQNQSFPKIYEQNDDNKKVDENDHNADCEAVWCSLDGDADRLVFYSQLASSFHLLDGDRMAVLLATYFTRLFDNVRQQMRSFGCPAPPMRIRVVQTAYTNSAATLYLQRRLKLRTLRAKTGVKHLHTRALQHIPTDDHPIEDEEEDEDVVAIYFEANGHGTVLIREALWRSLETCRARLKGQQLDSAALRNLLEIERELRLVHRLINAQVGDGIALIFLVRFVLARLRLALRDWRGFYTDLPNQLCKVAVTDRNALETDEEACVVLRPAGFEQEICREIREFAANKEEMRQEQFRVYVRPSGTEDVVRVYVEAPTLQLAQSLAERITNLITASI